MRCWRVGALTFGWGSGFAQLLLACALTQLQQQRQDCTATASRAALQRSEASGYSFAWQQTSHQSASCRAQQNSQLWPLASHDAAASAAAGSLSALARSVTHQCDTWVPKEGRTVEQGKAGGEGVGWPWRTWCMRPLRKLTHSPSRTKHTCKGLGWGDLGCAEPG